MNKIYITFILPNGIKYTCYSETEILKVARYLARLNSSVKVVSNNIPMGLDTKINLDILKEINNV